MSEKPPRHPIFDRAYDPGRDPAAHESIGTEEEKKRVAAFEADLETKMRALEDKPRIDRFLPYLLVRSRANDQGTRPITGVFWECPDIWIHPGDPATAPDIPPAFGGMVQAGVPMTVYAHVWNLGLAPIVGVRVEFYWVDPTFGLDPVFFHAIGTTSVDLPPRTSLHCHRLVKCPKVWIPEFVNNGHECLLVRVSSLGDPIGPNEWHAWLNRHIGHRNITVMKASEKAAFLARLRVTLPVQAEMRISEIGREEADQIVRMLRPEGIPGVLEVIRVAAVMGTEMVGGYTLVVVPG